MELTKYTKVTSIIWLVVISLSVSILLRKSPPLTLEQEIRSVGSIMFFAALLVRDWIAPAEGSSGDRALKWARAAGALLFVTSFVVWILA